MARQHICMGADCPDCWAQMREDLGEVPRRFGIKSDKESIAELERQLAERDDVAAFREHLGPLAQFYEPFDQPWDDDPDVWRVRTQPGFIFDDAFWERFQCYPFRICHVAYYGPERTQEGALDRKRHPEGVFELRFSAETEKGQ